jgi:hypothetical protein
MQTKKTRSNGASLSRRIVAAILATMMVVTMLPLYAMAESPEPATGGGRS